MTVTVWEIWHSADDSEGTIKPRDGEVPLDLDDQPMRLLHSFEVPGTWDTEGSPKSMTHLNLRSAYADKWLYDEGAWPEGCKPLDHNVSPFKDE